MINSEFDLGNTLKLLRNRSNITTRKLAEIIEYSHGYISSVENGSKLSPSEDFIHKYLLGVNNNSVMLANYYIDLINELSEGRYNYSLLPTSEYTDEMKELHRSQENYSNVYIFSDYKNGNTKNMIFDEPINDIHFHLNEIDNQKYFRGVEISEEEMEDIDKLINDYLINKYKTQISQSLFLQFEGLVSKESLKFYITKYNNILKKLGIDIEKDSERRELLNHVNNHFNNEGD